MELRTRGAGFFSAAAAASFFNEAGAAGVVASLKGCAAEVEVAAGGACDDVEESCRGLDAVVVLAEMGVALRRGVVEKAREACEGAWDIRAREAARRQLRQIIFGGWRGAMEGRRDGQDGCQKS